jgi:hypothetical protein
MFAAICPLGLAMRHAIWLAANFDGSPATATRHRTPRVLLRLLQCILRSAATASHVSCQAPSSAVVLVNIHHRNAQFGGISGLTRASGSNVQMCAFLQISWALLTPRRTNWPGALNVAETSVGHALRGGC